MRPPRPLMGLAATVTALVLSSAPAQAQSAVAAQAMPVTGNAPQVCAMQNGTVQAGGLLNINGIDGDTLRIQQLTDPQTLAARAAHATVVFSAVCNFPHRVRIESQNNGLWPTDGSMSSNIGGFTYALPYQARLRWGTVNGALDANASVRQIAFQLFDINDATAGNLELDIELQQGASNVAVNSPVLAGAYGDTLRIFLEPR